MSWDSWRNLAAPFLLPKKRIYDIINYKISRYIFVEDFLKELQSAEAFCSANGIKRPSSSHVTFRW